MVVGAKGDDPGLISVVFTPSKSLGTLGMVKVLESCLLRCVVIELTQALIELSAIVITLVVVLTCAYAEGDDDTMFTYNTDKHKQRRLRLFCPHSLHAR